MMVFASETIEKGRASQDREGKGLQSPTLAPGLAHEATVEQILSKQYSAKHSTHVSYPLPGALRKFQQET